MSLTKDDLQQIRTIITEEVGTIVRGEVKTVFDETGRRAVREEVVSIIDSRMDPRFDTLEGRIKTLNNDVKDIYKMISTLQKLTRRVAHFEKFDLEQKVIITYKNILSIAKEAGIKLPEV